MVPLTEDAGPFVHGTCAFCEVGLWPGKRPGQPRVICDSPECKRAACAYGSRRAQARARAKRRELGDGTHRCPQCSEVKPWDAEHFYPCHRGRSEDAPAHRFDSWCKDCRRRASRESHARRRDAANAANEAARQRRLKAETPEEHADRLERQRQASERYRKSDPEHFARLQVESRARVMADPVRRAQRNEAARLRYRMQAEREGREVRPRTRERDRDEQRQQYGRLPAAPLAAAVERHIARELAVFSASGRVNVTREAIAESLGTTARTLSAWREDEDGNAERERVAFDTADTILQALGLHPWDVWEDPDVLALWGC